MQSRKKVMKFTLFGLIIIFILAVVLTLTSMPKGSGLSDVNWPIFIVIGALIVITLILFLTAKGPGEKKADDKPEFSMEELEKPGETPAKPAEEPPKPARETKPAEPKA